MHSQGKVYGEVRSLCLLGFPTPPSQPQRNSGHPTDSVLRESEWLLLLQGGAGACAPRPLIERRQGGLRLCPNNVLAQADFLRPSLVLEGLRIVGGQDEGVETHET